MNEEDREYLALVSAVLEHGGHDYRQMANKSHLSRRCEKCGLIFLYVYGKEIRAARNKFTEIYITENVRDLPTCDEILMIEALE